MADIDPAAVRDPTDEERERRVRDLHPMDWTDDDCRALLRLLDAERARAEAAEAKVTAVRIALSGGSYRMGERIASAIEAP